MKQILLTILVFTGSFSFLSAQLSDTLVVFEAEMDTTGWEVFGNGADPLTEDVTVVTNPDISGINSSSMALRVVVNEDADPWAGLVLRDYFLGDSAIAITENRHTISMMVYRNTIGNVGIKLETGVGGAYEIEVVTQNSLINQWEVLTFDFSDVIGSAYEALTIFPDFPETRTAGAEVYIDDIMFVPDTITSSRITDQIAFKVYPNPVNEQLFVQHPDITGYAISNSLGQIIERKTFGSTNFQTINVGNLTNGIHFLTIESKNRRLTTRFVKK